MEFSEVIKHRKSTRTYKKASTDPSLLEKVLEETTSGPSAGNLQAYCIYVVKNQKVLNQLKDAAWWQDCVNQAGLALVFCAKPAESASKYGERGSNLYAIQDATIAAAYCQLSATNSGLSSVWVGAFNANEVAIAINAKKDEIPVAIIPLGYADEKPSSSPKKHLENIIQWIK
jgi:nitroreductase